MKFVMELVVFFMALRSCHMKKACHTDSNPVPSCSEFNFRNFDLKCTWERCERGNDGSFLRLSSGLLLRYLCRSSTTVDNRSLEKCVWNRMHQP